MFKLIPIFILLFSFCACENAQFRNREKGALAGGALGAGLGAIVGRHTGGTGAGIAIGSALGALSGAVIGNNVDNQEDRLDQSNQRLQQNERQLAENRKILDQLRRSGVDAKLSSRGVVANLPDVLFEFGSSELTGKARDTIKEIAKVISSSSNRRISVEGHTDSVGSQAYNLELSRNRAGSAARELEQNGVSRSAIRTRGFGERQPVASNNSDAGRARNRRVEVIIENPR